MDVAAAEEEEVVVADFFLVGSGVVCFRGFLVGLEDMMAAAVNLCQLSVSSSSWLLRM